MAGDRGLAFVLVGLMGSTLVWVGHARMNTQRARPAIHAADTSIGVLRVGPRNTLIAASVGEDSKALLAAMLRLPPVE
jgi:hypothetical protein